MNADASFWRGYRSTLLTALFMTTSRLFDPVDGAVTVQKLVSLVLGNLHLFSKDALRTRRMGKGPKPEWLDEFMDGVWTPEDATKLRHLKKALRPHVTRFTQIYLPIRNNIYAHRLMAEEEAATSLLPGTNRDELGETIDFLQDLVRVIYDLFYNGREPVLGNLDLTKDKKEACLSVERVLRKLVKAPSA